MHKAVKENVDNGDIERLKYIFADCLNVDPTFEDYKEDYEYCKNNVPGLFEIHKEITPLTKNQKEWNHDYWVELKIDLIDNFSKERFEHMKEVAKVIYAEQINIINKKREEERKIQNADRQKIENIKIPGNNNINNRAHSGNKSFKTREEQERELKEAREQLTRENPERTVQRTENIQEEDNSLKKLIGVLLAIAIILVILIMILNNLG